jgi:2-hydroxy fatty acid dioxygenase
VPVQSLVLAPLFVWLEVLFSLGYRKRLQAELNARVNANIAAYRAQQRAADAAAVPLLGAEQDKAGATDG